MGPPSSTKPKNNDPQQKLHNLRQRIAKMGDTCRRDLFLNLCSCIKHSYVKYYIENSLIPISSVEAPFVEYMDLVAQFSTATKFFDENYPLTKESQLIFTLIKFMIEYENLDDDELQEIGDLFIIFVHNCFNGGEKFGKFLRMAKKWALDYEKDTEALIEDPNSIVAVMTDMFVGYDGLLSLFRSLVEFELKFLSKNSASAENNVKVNWMKESAERFVTKHKGQSPDNEFGGKELESLKLCNDESKFDILSSKRCDCKCKNEDIRVRAWWNANEQLKEDVNAKDLENSKLSKKFSESQLMVKSLRSQLEQTEKRVTELQNEAQKVERLSKKKIKMKEEENRLLRVELLDVTETMDNLNWDLKECKEGSIALERRLYNSMYVAEIKISSLSAENDYLKSLDSNPGQPVSSSECEREREVISFVSNETVASMENDNNQTKEETMSSNESVSRMENDNKEGEINWNRVIVVAAVLLLVFGLFRNTIFRMQILGQWILR